MPKLFTDEQMEQARSVRLSDYLQLYEASNITVRERYDEIRLKDHGSFVLTMSNDLFDWKSQQIGGKGALDYLIKVRGCDFKEAVSMLISGGALNIPHTFSPVKPKIPEAGTEKIFKPPPKDSDADAVRKYLTDRGIDGGIVDECIADGSIYQTTFYSEKAKRSFENVVFVGFDRSGNDEKQAKYACIRSTVGNIKQDAVGSNKAYNFLLPADGKARAVSVFESPIDALSGATIIKRQYGKWYRNIHRLSLGGVSDLALRKFLDAFPDVNTVNLCLDNDEAGCKGCASIKKMLDELSKTTGKIYKVNIIPPKHGKDYNEMLTMETQKSKNKESR